MMDGTLAKTATNSCSAAIAHCRNQLCPSKPRGVNLTDDPLTGAASASFSRYSLLDGNFFWLVYPPRLGRVNLLEIAVGSKIVSVECDHLFRLPSTLMGAFPVITGMGLTGGSPAISQTLQAL